jgi:hypothetical protein
MSTNFDAKFGPAPVPITAPDVRLSVLQFTTLTLITYLSGVCFVVPRDAKSPSIILSALTAAMVTAITYVIVVRSNYNAKI